MLFISLTFAVLLPIVHLLYRLLPSRGQSPVLLAVSHPVDGWWAWRFAQATLDKDRMSYFSSDTVVNPNDPANYLPDASFIDIDDDRLAEALDQRVTQRLARPAQAGS